ncbi:MAG: DUF2892 domain-containing protein [Acidobacteriota bacterium]|nr:MAG: DUF2892 domain-containing protein [Acidobacteriota bacterium]
MDENCGTVDRAFRVIVGIALLSLIVALEGPMRFIGVIGVVPLATGLVGSCPLYRVFGWNTCSVRRG